VSAPRAVAKAAGALAPSAAFADPSADPAANAAANPTAEISPNPPADLPADWPQRQHSRAINAGGWRWHVQVAGRGPVLVLLHGTGASAHSWAELLPALAAQYTVVVPDLPGHGYTRGERGPAAPADLTLPRIVTALRALLIALHLPPPQAVAGHSAGAALALRWALDLGRERGLHPDGHPDGQPDRDKTTPPGMAAPLVLGFAPSLVAPPALYTQWVAPWMTPLSTAGWVAGLTARWAGPSGLVDRLLDSTGSSLSTAQRMPYRRLFADAGHVRGSVGFMAAADLPRLLSDARLAGSAGQPAGAAPRCAFVLGTRDSWVPASAVLPVIGRDLPQAEVLQWEGGHLVHEERAAEAAAWMLARMAVDRRSADDGVDRSADHSANRSADDSAKDSAKDSAAAP